MVTMTMTLIITSIVIENLFDDEEMWTMLPEVRWWNIKMMRRRRRRRTVSTWSWSS